MENQGSKFGTCIYKAAMLIFDILAVNFAYWIALICRFFVAYQFRTGADQYFTMLGRISPYYTVLCVLVFIFCNMYNTLWKIAGIRDLNKILLANAITTVCFIAGTLIAGDRMPLSIYIIGPVFQLALIGLSRLGIKLILMERDHMRHAKSATVNAMIVGIKFIGINARRQIDGSGTMTTKCVVDTQSAEKGRVFDGVPVIGMDGIEKAIDKYAINYILIADSFLSDAQRQDIRSLCETKGVELADMTGYLENGTEALSVVNLLQAVEGPVRIIMDGAEKEFKNGEQAMLNITKRYLVGKISARSNVVSVELSENPLVPNDTNETWVEKYKEETGSDVSFF